MTTPPTGADRIAQRLHRHGVDTIFCITGAGNLALVDALSRHGAFRLIYCHHEQAAVMAAQGYARVSGKVGVCLVTTGGGTSNAATGILSAYLDSTPILLISGNESSYHCAQMQDFRAYGVQGFDSVALMESICKSSSRVTSAEDAADSIPRALQMAKSGRFGPVHVDVPMDLQRAICNKTASDLDSSLEDPPRAMPGLKPSSEDSLKELVKRIAASERPLVYIGVGARHAGIGEDLTRWLTTLRLPYALSWSAIDLIHGPAELNVGRIGIYGDRAANILLQQADLLVCLGTRLAIPQVGYDLNDFGRKADRWVLDIDPIELTKFNSPTWTTVHADLAQAVPFLVDASDDCKPETESWIARIGAVKEHLPRSRQGRLDIQLPPGCVHSLDVIDALNELLADDAVIVTDVGAGLLTGHYALDPKPGQRVFTSQGLGEMGFGLPAAIGAYFADPNRQIICLNTDGGLMFNVQELSVVQAHNIPVKLFVFNNFGYSMIRISQENLFEGRQFGSSTASGLAFPNLVALAEAFGMSFTRVRSSAEAWNLGAEALASPRPELIEIVMSPSQKYLPRLATTKTPSGKLVSPPLEDLDPLLPLQDLASMLGYSPTAESVSVRMLSGDE